MVQKDMKRYTTVLGAWQTAPGFAASLDVLLEVGTLFVIKPEALRDRLRTGTLASVKPADLRPYLLRREDVASVGMQSVLAAI